MPLLHSALGARSASIEQVASTRWLMAYSAGVGAVDEPYLDTRQAAGVAPHPVFPVCLEWPALQALREHQQRVGLSDEELARNVHGSLDLHLLRPVRPDETLFTQAEIIGLQPRGRNAWQWVRVDTFDVQGQRVARSFQGGVYLDVAIEQSSAAGEPSPPTPWVEPVPGSVEPAEAGDPLQVAAGAAHVYSETSRIWNPAHTDLRVALAAHLPGLILHGTATLAMAVTQLVRRHVGDPRRIRRLGCRFGAPVAMPSTLALSVHGTHAGGLCFQVHDAQGHGVLRSGFLVWD